MVCMDPSSLSQPGLKGRKPGLLSGTLPAEPVAWESRKAVQKRHRGRRAQSAGMGVPGRLSWHLLLDLRVVGLSPTLSSMLSVEPTQNSFARLLGGGHQSCSWGPALP